MQAEAWRREVLATMVFAGQWDELAEKLEISSPQREELKKYSAAWGRYLKRGVRHQSLFVEYLVDL
jgi:hypothetical protein